MNITPRSLLSATTGVALVAFTTSSALVSGMAASTTVLGFALLAIYGLVEIMVLSYASRPVRVRRAPVMVAMPTVARRRVRVPALIERPVSYSHRRAA